MHFMHGGKRMEKCYQGYLTHEETSGIQGRPWVRPERILGIEDRELDPAPPATLTKSELFYPEFE
jgi:alanine dehydrogenase